MWRTGYKKRPSMKSVVDRLEGCGSFAYSEYPHPQESSAAVVAGMVGSAARDPSSGGAPPDLETAREKENCGGGVGFAELLNVERDKNARANDKIKELEQKIIELEANAAVMERA